MAFNHKRIKSTSDLTYSIVSVDNCRTVVARSRIVYTMCAKGRDFKTKVIVYKGPTGCGKTSRAHEEYPTIWTKPQVLGMTHMTDRNMFYSTTLTESSPESPTVSSGLLSDLLS